MGNRKNYETILRDSELLDYAREQARYTYLFDIEKFWRYVPGGRFRSQAYITWRKSVKKAALDEKAKEPDEPNIGQKRKAEDTGLDTIDTLIEDSKA